MDLVTPPIPQGPEILILVPFSISDFSSTSSESSIQRRESVEVESGSNQQHLFEKEELYDLTRELGFSKDDAQLSKFKLHDLTRKLGFSGDARQLLGSGLHAKHFLQHNKLGTEHLKLN